MCFTKVFDNVYLYNKLLVKKYGYIRYQKESLINEISTPWVWQNPRN